MSPVFTLLVVIVAITAIGSPSSIDGPSYRIYPRSLGLIAVAILLLEKLFIVTPMIG
jgi:hypothetical protein